MDECEDYRFRWRDIIIFPKSLIYKLCFIRDKSELLLSSCLRAAFYYYLTRYLLNRKWVATDLQNIFKFIGYIILLTILISNIFLIPVVILKMPMYDQDRRNALIQSPVLETRTAGPSEAEKITVPDVLYPPSGRAKSIS